MNLRNQFEYRATASLLALCNVLPEAFVYGLFKSFARLMFHVMNRRRSLVLKNLEIAFPEKSEQERRRLAKLAFVNLADSMAFNTFIMSGRIDNKRLMDSVEVVGWDYFVQARADSNNGLLGYTAHIGNWELLPQYVALRLEEEVYVIARQTTNPLLEDRIVRPLRERFGVNIFYKRNALTRIVKVSKKNRTTGILVDQKLNIHEGIVNPFFGRDAGTTATPALLQIRFGIPTIPVFMTKAGPGKYRLIYRKPTEWTDNGKPMEEQIRELTALHQKEVEKIITEYPDQWFWMHNRWGLPKAER